MTRERNERGQYTTGIDDRDILTFIEHSERPFQTTQAVADRFDFERSTAYRRLQQLANNDILRKEDIGARAVVWWIPENGKKE